MLSSWKKITAVFTLSTLLCLPGTAALADVPIVQNNLFPEFLTSSTASSAEQGSDSISLKSLEVKLDETTEKINYCLLSADSDWTVDIVLAKAAVGSGEELASIAKRSAALVGISGSDFQNYDNTKPKDPYGILISRGRILHNDVASSEVLIFTNDGQVQIGTLTTSAVLNIAGTEYKINGLNHTPGQSSESVTIFDQNRGLNVGFNYGTNYIVQNGVVTKIQSNIDSSVPQSGYIINVTGANAELRKALKVNSAVKYSLVLEGCDLSNIQAALKIEKVLVKDGADAVNHLTLSQSDNTSVNRTAIGWNENGDLILVAGVRSTVSQLAEIMLKTGAVQAVSINGGASSGLIVENTYMTEPVCDISNALIFKEKPAAN